mgnify:CR=1 FL=1
MGGKSKEIETIIWDFDGVIVESNAIREKGFREVLEGFSKEEVEVLLEFHRRNGGLSRYVKFRHFFEVIRSENQVNDERVNGYAEKFSIIMRKLMTNKEILIDETVNFIRQSAKKYNFHIASGSDQQELRFLCQELGIKDYFKSIHGSPKPKNDIVREIIEENSYSNLTTLLIGDAINDYEAARLNGISFMAYNSPESVRAKSNFELGLV